MKFEAQLATLVKAAPEGEQWFHELKYDGYRIGCLKNGTQIRLLSRNGKDWTSRFPAVSAAARDIKAGNAVLDGEVSALLDDGNTSFQALQNAFGGANERLVYFVFDLLHLDGADLTGLPLEQRKERLRAILPSRHAVLRYSDHVIGHGPELLARACRQGAEGIVSKRRDVPYQPGRSGSWLKIKCSKRQEFVIGGFTEPRGSRAGLGALLIGVYDAGGELRYSGKVGTGFTQKNAADLRRRLDALESRECPFRPPLRTGLAGSHWVRPKLVGEVEFTEWTEDGKIRHPSFKGLRADKEARDVIREREPKRREVAPRHERKRRASATRSHASEKRVSTGKRSAAKEDEVAGVRISHPDRVVYHEADLTKIDVARFYDRIADHIVPHLADRPLTLLRCPDGVGPSCFYMKHSGLWKAEVLRKVSIRERNKTGEYLIADTREALITLVQMGVLEFHTWNSTAESLEQPDRVVFDLDPGPKVEWGRVVDTAQLLHSSLEALGLKSFVKTTGGNGLHVVVPLRPGTDWTSGLEFSRALARLIERSNPRLYTTSFAKEGREAKILIDYMRNSRGSTSVAAFSARARESAAVSFPLAWKDLSPRRRPDDYSITRLSRGASPLRADPWAAYWKTRQHLSAEVTRKLEESLR